MKHYPIVKNLVPGLQTTLYRNGTYEGVVAHATHNPSYKTKQNTPSGERSWTAQNYQNAFAHIFVGLELGAEEPTILMVADPNYIGYGAGQAANQRFVHVEICMYDDPIKFSKAYDAYCYALAKVLYDRKLGVIPAKADGTGTFWGHDDVSKWLGYTDHTDPYGYLAEHGISKDKLIADVTAYYNWIASPVPTAPQPSDYAKESWEKACSIALPSGQRLFDGSNPQNPITREMLAVILDRMGILDYLASITKK